MTAEDAPSLARDIEPKFRNLDRNCMAGRGIFLADAAWMTDPAAAFDFADHGNARHVFARLSNHSMPPGAPWSADWLQLYQRWMDAGFAP